MNEPPRAPAAPRLSAASKTGLGVTWTAPDNAQAEHRERPALPTAWQDGPQDVTGTGATIAGLAEETSYQVQLRAANDEGHGPWSASATGATSANSAPVFADATRRTSPRTPPDAAIGDPVPAATDADAGDELTYIMEGADAAAFDFDPATRQISTKAALDHEAKDSYALTIEVGDGTASDTIAVTVTVTDVNEPPRAPAAPRLSAASKTPRVTWTAPDNAGRPNIESYDLRYRALGHRLAGRTAGRDRNRRSPGWPRRPPTRCSCAPPTTRAMGRGRPAQPAPPAPTARRSSPTPR